VAAAAVATTLGAIAAPAGATAYDPVSSYGRARDLGPAATFAPTHPPVAIETTPRGRGYWIAAADGGVFSFGDARFHGSTGGLQLAAPIVDMSAVDRDGYWLAAEDGGVFTFGDAEFYGSTGDLDLAAPIAAMAVTPDGDGYWLAAEDGGVFTFGDADFHGSAAGLALGGKIVDIAATRSGRGYWLASSHGEVLAFGDAKPLPGFPALTDVTGIEAARGGGHYLVRSTGAVFAYDAKLYGYSEGDGVTVDVAAVRGGYVTLRNPLPPPPAVDANHPFLVCTRAHESGGNYAAVSASGRYRGAYQFSQATWNSTAASAGRPDLVGVDPAAAAPADQDYLALHLYSRSGASPWLGRCAGL
jgi:hypothetical protein